VPVGAYPLAGVYSSIISAFSLDAIEADVHFFISGETLMIIFPHKYIFHA
jgi:hypothetical protein